jgi:glycosyltransferase involved in cell wall biosynthesis
MTAPRVLLVETGRIVPEPTGSGNQAIRWGLARGLVHAGAEPAFYFAGPVDRDRQRYLDARAALGMSEDRFMFDLPCSGADGVRALQEAIATFRPDGILAYGPDALRLARAATRDVPVGIVSIDLEHLPVMHRHAYFLRHGRPKQRIKSALEWLGRLRQSREVEREVRATYPLADVIINHAHHHAQWHAATHGRPVLYTPNTLAPIAGGVVRCPASPPRFSLMGGLGGIATLSGLAWYAMRVHHLLLPAIRAGELEIHLVGRGDLDPTIDARLAGVVRRGYVEDLAGELAETTALLVPTPIELGFRTRIADGFRHGVTSVAHAANAKGMPEMMHERNALVADTPQGFADAVLRLAREPALAVQLGAQGLRDFDERISSDVTAQRILQFLISRGKGGRP